MMLGTRLGQPCTGGVHMHPCSRTGWLPSWDDAAPSCGVLQYPHSHITTGMRFSALKPVLLKMPFPKTCFPEGFRCPSTHSTTHPSICTFDASFYICHTCWRKRDDSCFAGRHYSAMAQCVLGGYCYISSKCCLDTWDSWLQRNSRETTSIFCFGGGGILTGKM